MTRMHQEDYELLKIYARSRLPSIGSAHEHLGGINLAIVSSEDWHVSPLDIRLNRREVIDKLQGRATSLQLKLLDNLQIKYTYNITGSGQNSARFISSVYSKEQSFEIGKDQLKEDFGIDVPVNINHPVYTDNLIIMYTYMPHLDMLDYNIDTYFDISSNIYYGLRTHIEFAIFSAHHKLMSRKLALKQPQSVLAISDLEEIMRLIGVYLHNRAIVAPCP